MEEKLVNIYGFKLEDNTESYIYSLKEQENSLNYKYYILTRDENDDPIIYDAGNAIKTLQNNKINLIPIKENNEKYKIFLKELSSALNNTQKRTLSPKK
jgi:hypothetical protein